MILNERFIAAGDLTRVLSLQKASCWKWETESH